MTTAINRRITNLERAATDARPKAPVKFSVMLRGVEPELDESGKRYGPGRIVTSIELVGLEPAEAKP